MSLPGLLITTVMLAAATLLVLLPFRQARYLRQSYSAADLESRRTEYALIVKRLSELDAEHRTGTLADVPYAAERVLWVERGLVALAALDEAQRALQTPGDSTTAIDPQLDRIIEAAVARQARQQHAS
jgi:hypothetical protein